MTVVLVDARYYGDIMRQTGGGHRNGNRTNAHRPCLWGRGGVVLCTTGGGEITSNELPVTSNEPPPIIIANKATRTGGKCCLCLFPLHWWNKKNVCIRRNMIYNRHSAGEKLFILAFYMECKNE